MFIYIKSVPHTDSYTFAYHMYISYIQKNLGSDQLLLFSMINMKTENLSYELFWEGEYQKRL